LSDPTTTNVLLAVPTRGSDSGTWDIPVNANTTAEDGFFGGVQVVSVTNAPITLTAPAGVVTAGAGPTQAQNAVLRVTGSLTANVQITLPLPGYMIVDNLTTGSFVLSFKAAGSGEVIGIEQGVVQRIYNDGTNVRFVNLPTVGSYMDICDSNVPAWITACTKPPWLLCNGGTFSAVTYPYLNAKLGGTTLPDARGRVRAMLNQGTSRLNAASSGVDGNTPQAAGGTDSVILTGAEIPTITSSNATQVISVTGPNGHTVPLDASLGITGNGTGPTPVWAGGTQTSAASFSGSNNINVTSNNTGSSAHPNAQPTYIGGLTLIRAA